jgi:serine/threonine-protein kinase
MAPEQARGVDDIDHRADVWELCVLLYECVTGRVPFEDANYNVLLRHIIEDEIPSILEFGAGDDEFWALMKKGLEKDRDRCYQSMRELGEALAAWLMARGVMEDVSGHSLAPPWSQPAGASLVSGDVPRFDTSPPPADSVVSAPLLTNPTPLGSRRAFESPRRRRCRHRSPAAHGPSRSSPGRDRWRASSQFAPRLAAWPSRPRLLEGAHGAPQVIKGSRSARRPTRTSCARRATPSSAPAKRKGAGRRQLSPTRARNLPAPLHQQTWLCGSGF